MLLTHPVLKELILHQKRECTDCGCEYYYPVPAVPGPLWVEASTGLWRRPVYQCLLNPHYVILHYLITVFLSFDTAAIFNSTSPLD